MMNNLLANIPEDLRDEVVETLLEADSVRIERIVSRGQASPKGFWYDQDEHEWVVLLSGAARLTIEDEERPLDLKPGDSVSLPAHKRHRVEWTDPDGPTVWLAIFFT